MYYGMAPPMPPNYTPWFGPPMPPTNPVDQITDWIRGLEELKKFMKEEKKEEKKDDKKKPESNSSVFAIALLMLLLSPVTGPTMYHFFQLTLNMVK